MNKKNPESRATWVHTNIEAPYKFTIKHMSSTPTPRGVAFSASLVHPTLGVVGQIFNHGDGGPTRFDAADRDKFGARDLDAFLASCVQDGTPMATDFTGLEGLLDDIIDEAQTDDEIEAMRTKGGGLVRSFEPGPAGGYRGAPIPFTTPLVTRALRQGAADHLADSDDRLDENAHWQMFNGLAWIPLLDDPELTAEQSAKQLAEIQACAKALPEQGHRYVTRKRLNDSWHVWGNTMKGTFTLVSDAHMVSSYSWCRCARRRAGYTATFQTWQDNALVASGVVHAAQECRLLSLD